MENIINKINKEIERIQKEIINPAEHNNMKVGGNRIAKMIERFNNYKKALEDAVKEKDVNPIIIHANNIFYDIDWNCSDAKNIDIRQDTFKILVWILNLLTSNEDKNRYLKIISSKENFEKIVNIINTKED